MLKHRFREGSAWLARWERDDPRGSARSRLGAIGPLGAQEGDETLISIVLRIELATALIP